MLEKRKMKQIIYAVSFLLLFLIFIILILFTKDSEKIKEIKEFLKTDTKIIYIIKNESLSYPIELLDKYSIDYIKIDYKDLSIFERKKIKNIIDNNDITNSLVIYKNGKKRSILENLKEQEIVKFLQKNNIIPSEIVDNVEEIVTESNSILDSTYSMVYIPYTNLAEIEKQDQIFKDIASDYEIEYKKIDAYLLSNNQQEKMNSSLGLSLVEDQILILVKDNKMVANIRGVHSKNTYIEKLYSVNFINELENKINEIEYDEFNDILKDKEKRIILLGYEKEVNEVFNLLNEMIYNYDINVSFMNIDNSNLNNKVKEKLEEIGYNGAITYPLVIITESNKILEYVIGNSKEEYFIDIFIENGVIKGDVING